MAKLQKLGDIRINNGGLVLTQGRRNVAGQFDLVSGTAPFQKLIVRAPYFNNTYNSIDISLAGFVLINDVKYVAKVLPDNYIYAFAIEQVDEQFKTIKIGEATDARLALYGIGQRAYLTLLVMDPNIKYRDVLKREMGVYTFKTASVNAIREISNTAELIADLNPAVRRLLNLQMEVIVKDNLLAETDPNMPQTIEYVRILPPTLSDIAIATQAANNNPEIVSYLEQLEEIAKKHYESSIASAITVKEVKELFGECEITIDLDEESVGVTERAKAVKAKIINDMKPKTTNPTAPGSQAPQNAKVDKKLAELVKIYPNVPENMIRSCLHSYGIKRCEELLKQSDGTIQSFITVLTKNPPADQIISNDEIQALAHTSVDELQDA